MEACLAKEHFQLIVPQLKKYMIVSLIGITRYEMRNDTVCVIESDYAMGVYLTNLMMDRLTLNNPELFHFLELGLGLSEFFWR